MTSTARPVPDRQEAVMQTPSTCPTCGRPATRRAFGTTAAYVTDTLGHVFPGEVAA